MTAEAQQAPKLYAPEIAPCPFGCCLPPEPVSDLLLTRVKCPVCGAFGPLSRSTEQAIARWNASQEAETALVAVFTVLHRAIAARCPGPMTGESADRIMRETILAMTSPTTGARILAKLAAAREAADG